MASSSQGTSVSFDRALRFHEILRTHCIEFSDIAEMHAVEELSVLAVIVGLRPAALLVNMTASMFALFRDVAISFGLITMVPRRRRFEESDITYPPEIEKVFREHFSRRPYQPALWICADFAARERIRQEREPIGVLLDYPACCVEEESRVNRDVRHAFERAIVERAGGDPAVLRRALREDWRVELPPAIDERLRGGHIARSVSTFPFIFHVACSQCLESPESLASRMLNRRYREFAIRFEDAADARLAKGASV
jgi:hypothetical protein